MSISKITFDSPVQIPSIPSVTPVSEVRRVDSETREPIGRAEAQVEDESKEEAKIDAVLSKSEDGDLLTGEIKASYTPEEKTTIIAESEDGIVSKIEKVPDDDELVTDLTGYTKSQVEQLYREGKISRYNYEQNMQRREELKEEASAETAQANTEFAEDMGKILSDGETQTLEADALDKAGQNGRVDLMLDIFSNLK